jgi:YD repeat-containing protein
VIVRRDSGRITSVREHDATLEVSYDRHGDPTQLVARIAAGTVVTTLAFDANHHIVHEVVIAHMLLLDSTTQIVDYTYDERGRLAGSTEGTLRTNYRRDTATGRLLEISDSEGGSITLAYDASDRPTRIVQRSHSSSIDVEWDYDYSDECTR